MRFKYLEQDEQKVRKIRRGLDRNKTLNDLELLEKYDEYTFEAILKLAEKQVKGRRDLEWDIVNSLYYSAY